MWNDLSFKKNLHFITFILISQTRFFVLSAVFRCAIHAIIIQTYFRNEPCIIVSLLYRGARRPLLPTVQQFLSWLLNDVVSIETMWHRY